MISPIKSIIIKKRKNNKILINRSLLLTPPLLSSKTMDTCRSPLLSWAYHFQGKSMEEIRHSLYYTTLELETTRLQAQEEIRKRDVQLIHLKDLLSKSIRERDEARVKYQSLLLDKLLVHQQLHVLAEQEKLPSIGPHSGISTIEDDPQRGLDCSNGYGLSSSDCDESIVSSPVIDVIPPPRQQPPAMKAQATLIEDAIELVSDKPLPENGKFLQAVMKAGPLLQTLLLAGPLPQWKHPPPPLESFEIPPVTIPSIATASSLGRKRSFSETAERNSQIQRNSSSCFPLSTSTYA